MEGKEENGMVGEGRNGRNEAGGLGGRSGEERLRKEWEKEDGRRGKLGGKGETEEEGQGKEHFLCILLCKILNLTLAGTTYFSDYVE